MDDGRCATCEALGRRSLSSKLLQVATAQAHMKVCSHASPAEQHQGSDLASRALAAKRRKSIAGFKLNLPEATPKTPVQPRQNSGRRNTWCSASGTSAVAIDNKIEQAMDLVKSHLMFAVREEVEVLKERIAELMERINQLEVENSYLRAHASQDTLAQLPVVGSKPPPQAQGPQPPVS
ncbi:TSC22 domain family protein 2-like isoform X3 [Pieris napi]|uniref:TSC22 domain family protein 2-like isoform X3 n=1 Tax=Pieris napi TaxID=78633 RepID=UPI001FB97C55|nr:TSC22 domain family protein 2-like isoform X3 [Pieris napi]